MPLQFYRAFAPLTATPFTQDNTYREVPACPALAPLVRCFWGSAGVLPPAGGVFYAERTVVPDGCIDLIVRIDGARLQLRFCPPDRLPYRSAMQVDGCAVFAVRFYFWAATFLFPDMAAQGNECGALFPRLEALLHRQQFAALDFCGRQRCFEQYLLPRVWAAQPPPHLLNAVDCILATRGAAGLQQLERHTGVSGRTLQRTFKSRLGISPKALCEVVRYQSLWRLALQQPRFDLQDAVLALGFYDQSHLLHSFRQCHGAPLAEALQTATAPLHRSKKG